MSEPARILIVSPNWLGDAVMALPAMADIRRHFARARLIIAARRQVASLFRFVPGVDEVVELGWHGALLRTRARGDDLTRLRTAAPDVAILFPNSFATAWLVKRAAVPGRWGYATDLRRALLTRAVPTATGSLHQGEYYQQLVRGLGIATGPLEPVLAVPEAARDAARHLLAARGWDGARPIAVVAPGAAYGTAKRWLPAHFAQLSTRLIDDRRAHVVLVGSATDRETCATVAGAMAEAAIPFAANVAGETTLELLAGILGLASICISNDSGTMHLAAAAAVPVAAVFGPTRERETAPLPAPGGRTRVLINPVWCRPCMLRECPIDHRCMTGLMPNQVADAVGQLMGAA